MGTEEVELDYLEFFYKFNERLYIIMASISNGVEISEADYAVLEEVFRVWDSGRLPFVKTVCTEADTTTTQANLFSDITTDTITGYPDGTQFDYTVVNVNNKKNGHTKKIQK